MMKLNLKKQFLFKAKLKSFHRLPEGLTDCLRALEDGLELSELWEEVGVLDAYVKKSKPVFRGTPYFEKLKQVLHLFRQFDELQLHPISHWFASLLKEDSLCCQEALLVYLLRIHHSCTLFQDLNAHILNTAMEFNALRKHGHYPSTVVFAFAILGSLKMKVLLTVETLVDKYNQLIEWIGYFPVAARSSNFAEEIQRKLPIEITIKTEEGEIKMTTKEDPEWIISSKLIGNYLILSADKPEQKKKIERTKKRPQENETSLEKTKEKKPTMGRKLSLFDQMKYSANSSQELNSAEVSSTEMKTVPASSRIAHKSIQSAKISHPRTWESWFEENAIPESKPQNLKRKKRSKTRY